MDVSVNYLAVVLAALSTMVVGSIWYSPIGFYKPWAKMAGVKEDPSMTTGKMVWMYGTVFLASLLAAYILAHLSFLSNTFFKNSFLQDAVTTAFWVWLGIVATRIYVHDVFETRRKKLSAITLGYELVTFLAMGLIIGLMGN